MQHRTAAGISVGVEHRVLIVVVFGHDRTAVALCPCAEYGVVIAPDVGVKKFVVALELFGPHRLHVGREALIQPYLAPIAACNVIAKPLVSQLVRLQRFAVSVEQFAIIMDHLLDLRGRRDILHSAAKILNERLRVLGVRILNTRDLREETDRRRQVLSCCGDLFGLVRIAEIVDRNAVKILHDGRRFGNDDRRQVICIRLIHLPVECAGAVGVVFGIDKLAVGDDIEWLCHGRPKLGRAEIVRCIIRREPVTVKFRFALRPDLPRLIRIVGRRLDEPEPAAETADRGIAVGFVHVVRLVRDLDLKILSRRISAIERYFEIVVVGLFVVSEFQCRAAVEADRVDRHFCRIERKVSALGETRKRDHLVPDRLLLFPIKTEIDQEILCINRTAAYPIDLWKRFSIVVESEEPRQRPGERDRSKSENE